MSRERHSYAIRLDWCDATLAVGTLPKLTLSTRMGRGAPDMKSGHPLPRTERRPRGPRVGAHDTLGV